MFAFLTLLEGCGTDLDVESASAASTAHNLVIQIEATSAASALLEVRGPGLRPAQYAIERSPDDALIAPLYVAPGAERVLRVQLFDAAGRQMQSGELLFGVDARMTPEQVTTLETRGAAWATVRLGGARVAVVAEPDSEGATLLRATVLDPRGRPESVFFAGASWEGRVVTGRGYFAPIDQPGLLRFFPLAPFGEDVRLTACVVQFAGGREYRYCGKMVRPYVSVPTILDVAAGSSLCALKTNGETYCWGFDPPVFGYPGVALVPGGHAFRSIVSGRFTCGIESSGDTYCFGRDYLGDGPTIGSTFTPVRVAAPPFIQVEPSSRGTNSNACGLTTTHQTYCWGDNSYGQLGDGMGVGGAFNPLPGPTAGGVLFDSIAVGDGQTCALTASKSLYCWGDGHQGQLGFSAGDVLVPTASLVGPYEEVVAFRGGTCVRAPSGAVSCFGADGGGSLGVGPPTYVARSYPVEVSGQHQFVSMSAARSTVCAIDSSGRGWCWGSNDDGLTGTGSSLYRIDAPQEIAGNLRFSNIEVGMRSACGLTRTNEVYCWGFMSVPGGGSSNVPVEILIP